MHPVSSADVSPLHTEVEQHKHNVDQQQCVIVISMPGSCERSRRDRNDGKEVLHELQAVISEQQHHTAEAFIISCCNELQDLVVSPVCVALLLHLLLL